LFASFDNQHETLIAYNPDATEEINLVWTELVKIGQLIQTSPQNGNGVTWKRLVDKAENEKNFLCKHMYEKDLFTGMMRLYGVIHRELKDSLLPECAKGSEGDVPHSKRRKRNSDCDDGSSTSETDATDKSRALPFYQQARPVATKNFSASLRAVCMEGTEESDEGQYSANIDKGRPPPIFLTSEANILSLQKDLKTVVTGELFFRNTASGNRITTKNMADYKATQNLYNRTTATPQFRYN
jgi:hypothetical protein